MPVDRKLTVGSLFAGISEELNSDSKEQATSKQSGKSKTTPTVKKSWQNTGLKSHDTGMSGKSINSLTQTSSAEVSPVKTYPMRARELALREKEADYGQKWRGWSVKYDPATSSWKTSQLSLRGELMSFSETFPRSGIMQNGIASPLQPSEPIIKGTGSSLWLTPGTLQINSRSEESHQRREYHRSKTGRTTVGPGSLTEQIRWTGEKEMPICTIPIKFPTPASRDWRDGCFPAELQRNSETLAMKAGGQLNADWVELLMGFPKGYTEVD